MIIIVFFSKSTFGHRFSFFEPDIKGAISRSFQWFSSNVKTFQPQNVIISTTKDKNTQMKKLRTIWVGEN